MTRSRYVAAVVGTCALVVATMTIGVSGAFAAKWRVNGATVDSSGLIPETEADLTFAQGSLLFTTTGGTHVEIRCTALGLSFFANLEKEGRISSSTKAQFTGCTVFLNGEKSAACEAHSPGQGKGVIQTTSLKGSLGLNLGEDVITIQPTFGTTVATVELGAKCSVGESILIQGTLRAEDTSVETEAVTHQFKQNFFSSLTALGKPATLDGSVSVYLIFSHGGLKWSGLPE